MAAITPTVGTARSVSDTGYAPQTPELAVDREGTTLRVLVRGDWTLPGELSPRADQRLPAAVERIEIVVDVSARPGVRTVARLRRLLAEAVSANIAADFSKLPDGMRQLLELALAVRIQEPTASTPTPNFFEGTGVRLLVA